MNCLHKVQPSAYDQFIADFPKRLCRGQQQVIWALFQSKGLLSAQEIHRWLKDSLDHEAPGLTTIYRAVDTLTNLQLLHCVILSDGERRYELLTPGQHQHHIRCNYCRKSARLEECFVNNTRDQIQRQYGFVITSHIIEMSGICADCAGDAKHT